MNASGSGAADPDPNKSTTDPDSDPGGPKTYGSYGSESRTLLPLQHLQLTLALKKDACLKSFSLPDRNHVRTRLIIFFWSAPQTWRDAKFFPGKTQFQSRTSGHHRESGKSYSSSGCKIPFSLHLRSEAKEGTVLEFLNNPWGLGTE